MSLVATEPQPALAWSFDGTTTDYNTGLAGTVVGAPTYVNGKYNQAISIPGTQGVTPPTANVVYTLATTISVNNGCTLSCWVNVSTYGVSSGQAWFVYAITSAGNGIRLNYSWNTGTGVNQLLCQFYYAGSSATYIAYTTMTINTWYHYTCVIQSSGVNLFYINGSLVGTDSSAVGLVTNPTNITKVIVGSGAGFGQFNGLVDDLRVYNTALTADQVQSVYNQQGMPGRCVLTLPSTPSSSMTGAPLFTQLSPAATSSAVGAFSLRAVNGTTAKAVAVQAHPIVTWPPIAFTSGGDFTATGTYNGVTNGVYKSRDSYYPTSSVGSAWVLFDKNNTTYFIGSDIYNISTGAYLGSNSTTISSVSVFGEWVQLQSPVSFILRNYTITSRPNLTSQAPTTFWIAGSNDGTTWSNVHYQAGITLPQVAELNITVPQTSNSLAYSYYRLVASVLGNSTDTDFRNVFAFVTWDINGDAPSYAPNAAQDFYADRLGNLLTAPVVGQTLQNWLGGATGYVTTWYDQSGLGNHATQATAANQPVIQRATKGQGYSCLFNGTTNKLTFGTVSTLTGVPFTVNLVARRTAAVVGILAYGNNSDNNNHAFGMQINPDGTYNFSRRGGQGVVNYSIPTYNADTEPIYYLTNMLSSNFTNNVFSSGTYTGSTGTSWGGFMTDANVPFTIGQHAAVNAQTYYTGEIYELLVFTQSLYDLDNTGGLVTKIYQNQLSAYGT